MATKSSRYSREEVIRLGNGIYESKVRPNLKPADIDRFVAIDIESGEWELGDTEMEAYDHLRERFPNGQTWLILAGRPYLHSFGGRDVRSVSE